MGCSQFHSQSTVCVGGGGLPSLLLNTSGALLQSLDVHPKQVMKEWVRVRDGSHLGTAMDCFCSRSNEW